MIWDTDWTRYCEWCVKHGHRCTFAGFADWARERAQPKPAKSEARQYTLLEAPK